jgi:hypothetical protein
MPSWRNVSPSRNEPAGTGRDPADAHPVPEGRQMVTYYRGRTALVTHEVFEVWCPRFQRYSIGDLRDVQVTRGAPDPLALRSAGTAAVLLAGVAASWPFLHSPEAWLVAAVLVTVPAVLGGACWRRNPPEWVLRATYHSYQVELFRCTDAQTFGQVRRALLRALEGVRGW